MNKIQLRSDFRTIIELNSSGLPGLEDNEIDLYLDNAQYQLISQRLEGNNVYNTKYPETIKRIDDLNNLVKSSTITGPTVSQTETVNFYDFVISESDYLHFLNGTFIPNLSSSPIGRYKIKPIPLHLTHKFEESMNNHPYIENPVYILMNNGSDKILRVYFDLYQALSTNPGWQINLEFFYIKIPTDLKTVNESTTLMDFNEDAYKEITKIAVDAAIGTIAPQRAQVSNNQLTKSE